MGFFTHQSPRCVTCFFSIQSAAAIMRGSSDGSPLCPNAKMAYAVSHIGDLQGCMRKVVASSMPRLSNSSMARMNCGSSTEYPRQRSAMMEFIMAG